MASCTTPPPAKPTKLGIGTTCRAQGRGIRSFNLIEGAIDGEAFERAARATVLHPYVLRDGCIWKTVNAVLHTTRYQADHLPGGDRWRGGQTQRPGGRPAGTYIRGTGRRPSEKVHDSGCAVPQLGSGARDLGQGRRRHDPPAEDKEVAAAIQLVSPPDRRGRMRYANTGWVRHAGQDVFLDAQGAIGADGRVDGVEMALPPQLQDYVLEEPESPEDLQKAIRASLAIHEIAPLEITYPCRLLHIRHPSIRRRTHLFLRGHGSFKPCCIALPHSALWAQDDTSDCRRLRIYAHRAAGLVFLAKDVVFPVDDFPDPTTTTKPAQMEQKAEALFRGVGNHSARSRASRDGSLRPAHPPRALVDLEWHRNCRVRKISRPA